MNMDAVLELAMTRDLEEAVAVAAQAPAAALQPP